MLIKEAAVLLGALREYIVEMEVNGVVFLGRCA